MPADAVMPISVVIERRAANSQWLDHVWRPIGVLPRAASAPGTAAGRGRGLERSSRAARSIWNCFAARPRAISPICRKTRRSFSSCCGGTKTAEGLEYLPLLATACPYEAMGYTTGGDDIVEGVPMPPEVLAWVQEFVAAHHVDEPFQKRKNKRHKDDYGGKRPRPERERGDFVSDDTTAKLSRWSQRKLAARRGGAVAEPPRGQQDAAVRAARSKQRCRPRRCRQHSRGRPRPDEPRYPELPPIEGLNFQSDYTVFLAKNVPETLRRAALRKLWVSDPVLANLDGLNDYCEDLNIVDTPITLAQTSYKVGKGYLDEIEEKLEGKR